MDCAWTWGYLCSLFGASAGQRSDSTASQRNRCGIPGLGLPRLSALSGPHPGLLPTTVRSRHKAITAVEFAPVPHSALVPVAVFVLVAVILTAKRDRKLAHRGVDRLVMSGAGGVAFRKNLSRICHPMGLFIAGHSEAQHLVNAQLLSCGPDQLVAAQGRAQPQVQALRGGALKGRAEVSAGFTVERHLLQSRAPDAGPLLVGVDRSPDQYRCRFFTYLNRL